MDSYERKYLLTWLLMNGTTIWEYNTDSMTALKRAAFGGDHPPWVVSSLLHMRIQGYLEESSNGRGAGITQKALDELVSDNGTNYPEVDCG